MQKQEYNDQRSLAHGHVTLARGLRPLWSGGEVGEGGRYAPEVGKPPPGMEVTVIGQQDGQDEAADRKPAAVLNCECFDALKDTACPGWTLSTCPARLARCTRGHDEVIKITSCSFHAFLSSALRNHLPGNLWICVIF